MKCQNKIIQLQEVSFVYSGEKTPVWQGLTCFFEKNKINLLLGPSGCGKSTLLYLLSGIIPHIIEGTIEGRVLLEGESIEKKEPKELASTISTVFQDPDCQFCTFRVEDEIAFGMENQGISPSEMKERIDASLQMVGMSAYKKHLLDQLSGGQKQKIAIASALAMQTELLLMDEPTANLDAKSRQEIFALLKKLVKDYHKTIIIVEHNLDGLIEMVEHAVVLNNKGEVSLCGSGSKVFTSLVFEEKFWDTGIFLPEKLLILRNWVRKNKENKLVREYGIYQLTKGNETIENTFQWDIKSLEEVYQRQGRDREKDEKEKVSWSMDNRSTRVSLENLTFSYEKKGNYPILDEMNLSIQTGDFLAIVGPNGVGKSTLLSVLFKVFSKYQGTIYVNQKDLKRVSKKELYDSFGLVFQNPEVQFVTNDVYSELLFSLKKTTLSLEEKKEKVETMLSRFQLGDCKNKSPFALSQGQKRRLSVATMLLTGQEVLFFDEPTYGQDLENQQSLMELLRQLNQEGVTIIMITHDMSTVVEYANKVALLLDGKVAFEGNTEDLFLNTTLVEKGNLELPGAYQFSKEIKKQFEDFPLCFTKEACVQALNQRTREE